MGDVPPPFPHRADPDVFTEALAYSEADTGFTVTLIEKDYFCSLVLWHVFRGDTRLVFRGGTCLAKVYAGFYRLSEDLDLVIPVDPTVSRNERRAKIEPVRAMLDVLPNAVPGLQILSGLEGHNQSRQYIASLQYQSGVEEKDEVIKIEVGLREPLLSPFESRKASTIAINPFTGSPLLGPIEVQAMSLKEAYAEKTRAALSRLEPAIRDFYDLQYALREVGLDIRDGDFLRMVKAKLDVPGTPSINLSEARRHELEGQTEGQLRPVLRPVDFARFNLDEAFDLVGNIAEKVLC
jgi:predicted nucleotidyltransferase component of viral defense system